MARIRQIKPEFFTDAKLASCGVEAMLLFEGLWLLADREGRLKDIPFWIHGQVFPFFQDMNIDEILSRLHANELISRYTVGDGKYIQIVNFTKHQNPHQKEAPSIIPCEPTGRSTGKGSAQPRKRQCRAPEKAVLSPADSNSNSNTDSNSNITHAPASPEQASPIHKAVTGYFFDEYKRRFGVSYPHAGGKDGMVVKRIVAWAGPAGITEQQIEACINAFFETDDEWVQTKGGFTLSVFWLQLPKIAPRIIGNMKGIHGGTDQQNYHPGAAEINNRSGGIRSSTPNKYANLGKRGEKTSGPGGVGVAEGPKGKESE